MTYPISLFNLPNLSHSLVDEIQFLFVSFRYPLNYKNRIPPRQGYQLKSRIVMAQNNESLEFQKQPLHQL